ncbi:DivIVA domain-containing protein [Corynebacterium aquilae]|uniref:Cell division initiation protein n=1 Tax=Corynebacterium aquilae DSM 44791 TaxID=1431546 RepID=A0A1L7CGR2_9CORY|nr:DivIVA domain-containing protein [Corynebacterium aquilae]APT85037.1 hypothetical protein CAQU_08070 [Corynebacterium aquilae DSM 44791]
MYTVLSNLSELIELVETAHQVPLSQNCMVPRATVLTQLEAIRDDLPDNLENAAEVLAEEEDILNEAQHRADALLISADEEANRILEDARQQAADAVEEAKRQAQRTVAEAAERAARAVDDARRDAHELMEDATLKRDRMLENANSEYNRILEDARQQQEFLISDAEVVRRAEAEAHRIVDTAHADSLALRRDCDDFVDGKLGELQTSLSETLRRIERDRSALRRGAGVAGTFEGYDRPHTTDPQDTFDVDYED